MAAREEILSRYSQARESAIDQDKDLTPAQFMLAGNPGTHKVTYKGAVYYSKYSNPRSAARAYRKVKSGETSGEKMMERGRLYTYRAPGVERGFIVGEPRGQYSMGLWKVIVHMNWTDQDGKVHEDEERSFIVRSDKYENYFDAQSVINDSDQAVQDHVEAWEDDYGVGEVEIIYVEAIRVQTTSKEARYIVEIE